MSETIVRPEFVEDPRITTAVQQLPPLEGRAGEDRGHGPPETGSSIDRSLTNRCGFNPAGSESADDDDFDLVSTPSLHVFSL